MGEENRKNIVVLLSSPMKINVVINILALATLLFAAFSGVLFQLERLVRVNLGDMFKDQEYLWLGTILNQIKFLIPSVFFLLAVLIYLLGAGIKKRLNGEMVALSAQIDWIMAGDLNKRRSMRKEDAMEPVMTKIHQLADKLKR